MPQLTDRVMVLPRFSVRVLQGAVKSRAGLILVVDLVFIGVVAILAPDFLRLENFNVILVNMAPHAIVVGAMVMLMAAGRFDISIDGNAALSGVIVGELLMAQVAPLLAVLAGVAIGCSIGLFNGFLVEKLGVNPLITTLGMWWVASGAALGVTEALATFGFPDFFNAIGRVHFLGIHILIWYAAASILIMYIVLGYTKFGYHIYATGGGQRAAQLHGVNTQRLGFILFLLVGALVGFIGVVFTARVGMASPMALDGMALKVIAACVIGGASLGGGEGSVLGGLLALLLLHMITNAAMYVGISAYWHKTIVGAVLILAVVSDVLSKRPSRTGRRWPWWFTHLIRPRARD